MEIREIFYGTEEYEAELKLRDRVLRKPLGMSLYDQDLEVEKEYLRIAAFWSKDENKETQGNLMVATLLLVPQSQQRMQCKQMAVEEAFRHKHIGKKMMAFAENLAKKQGYREMVLHARKVALHFYVQCGYEIQGKEFQEVGIPHYVMVKKW